MNEAISKNDKRVANKRPSLLWLPFIRLLLLCCSVLQHGRL
jgi:hypothetical protein